MPITPYSSSDPTYVAISKSLGQLNPAIDLGGLIMHGSEEYDRKINIGPTTNEGVEFVPFDHITFRRQIRDAKDKNGLPAFHYDDRKVWAFKLGALFTEGAGYRQIGSPSLHIAIAKDICSVHLDDFGFVSIGPDGKTYYTLDALPHIGDELIYRAYIRKYARLALVGAVGETIARPATELLDRSYLALPTLSKLNMLKLTEKVDLGVGLGMKIAETDNMKIRFEYTCKNGNCSDNQYMVTMDLDLDGIANRLKHLK